MNDRKEKEPIQEGQLEGVSGGTIINRDDLEDFIRRMKANGTSKAAAVGIVTTVPEVNNFSTDPWTDMNELRALASEIYDKA